jgi:D-aminopeptidase
MYGEQDEVYMPTNTLNRRQRLRDLGITIGHLPTGTYNAITDVPGVKVGHTTLIYDEPRIARTGVTMILPRGEPFIQNRPFAAYYSFNGNGEMTGLPWIEESGMLTSSIGITNTYQVGIVRDALIELEAQYDNELLWCLPVVAETYDGFLNDIGAFHLKPEHVHQALESAQSGPVVEGNIGGGTGMICHGFKGGIGTSSRLVKFASETYTVGVLVQANYGRRELLRVDGVPVGEEITPKIVPLPGQPAKDTGAGSIIVIIATDAPLLPGQCKRLAQRATVGLGRVGGYGHNSSGDIFLAFATGNDIPASSGQLYSLRMIPQDDINDFLTAVVEATEESILNALCAAETMQGYQGMVHALPLDELQRVMARYRPQP